MTTTTWRTAARAVIDEVGEASRIDIDALAALPFVTSDYADGMADPLYCAGIVAHWPGAHTHDMAVADAIATAERAEEWDDAERMREALPSLAAIVTRAEEVAELVGWEDHDAIARVLPSALAVAFGDHGWRASVGRGLTRGPRVVVAFDV